MAGSPGLQVPVDAAYRELQKNNMSRVGLTTDMWKETQCAKAHDRNGPLQNAVSVLGISLLQLDPNFTTLPLCKGAKA